METQREKSREIRVKASKDYDMFESLPDNRPIIGIHARKLQKSIEHSNDLHLHPIVVTPDLQVIDGQHRLHVAKNLDVPIYYVVDENYSSEKIMLLNSNQKNWSLENFIEYWCYHGKADFIRLKEMKEHFDLPYMILVEWLITESRGDTGKKIREGTLRVPENPPGLPALKHGYALMQIMKESNFRPTKIYHQRAFNHALRKIFTAPIADPARFFDRFDKYPYNIDYKQTWREYVDQLADIYNYKMKSDVIKVVRSHNRVEFTK